MQLVPCLSAFTGVRVPLQHYCTTALSVFGVLFNLVSTGLTAIVGSGRKHRSARSSLATRARWPGTEVFPLLCDTNLGLPPATYAALQHFTGTTLETRVRLKTLPTSSGCELGWLSSGFPPTIAPPCPCHQQHNAKLCREPRCFPGEALMAPTSTLPLGIWDTQSLRLSPQPVATRV